LHRRVHRAWPKGSHPSSQKGGCADPVEVRPPGASAGRISPHRLHCPLSPRADCTDLTAERFLGSASVGLTCPSND
jgi:hypothetical protein